MLGVVEGAGFVPDEADGIDCGVEQLLQPFASGIKWISDMFYFFRKISSVKIFFG
jgi:hypothetical protein